MGGHNLKLINSPVLIVDKSIASEIRSMLIEQNLLNHKIIPHEMGTQIAIPILTFHTLKSMTWFDEKIHTIDKMNLSEKKINASPAEMINYQILSWLSNHTDKINNQFLLENLPKKWEILGDLALIPNKAMNNDRWNELIDSLDSKNKIQLWQIIASCLGVSRVARQNQIADDIMRTSQVEMLLGDSGIVNFTDYGVKFSLDVTKVMFSSGNITERHRIGNIDMTKEIVVDAFAGIGYYTLPMLVRSNATHVYACEMNPNSIKALKDGAKKNEVMNKLTILEGDNQESMLSLKNIADRVHLGILPSSETTWKPALECLKKQGGTIHIHMNVKEEEIEAFSVYCVKELEALSKSINRKWSIKVNHIEKVKWYAPRIRHIVLDVIIN